MKINIPTTIVLQNVINEMTSSDDFKKNNTVDYNDCSNKCIRLCIYDKTKYKLVPIDMLDTPVSQAQTVETKKLISAKELKEKYIHNEKTETKYWLEKIEAVLIEAAKNDDEHNVGFRIYSRIIDIDFPTVCNNVLTELDKYGYKVKVLGGDAASVKTLMISW